MARIVAVPEEELSSIRQRREALEKELSKELEIEDERKRVTELEQKIRIEQKKIHPSKFVKFQATIAELGKLVEKVKEKKLQGVIQ
jgi:hypothetical protein